MSMEAPKVGMYDINPDFNTVSATDDELRQRNRESFVSSMLAEIAGFRGEQPDSLALPNAGALSGDVPRSKAERSEA